MRKRTLILSASILFGALLGGSLAAEPAQTPKPDSPKPEVTTQPVPRAAAQVSTNARPQAMDRTEFMTRFLGLTDEQKEKLRPVFAEETKQIAELRKNTQMPAEERRTKYQEIRNATDAKMKEVLTAEQWEKYSSRGKRPAPATPGAPAPVRPAAPPK